MRRDLPSRTGSGRRSRPAAGRCATPPRATTSSAVTEVVYGRRPVRRGAARPARGGAGLVHAALARGARVAARAGLGGGAGPAGGARRERGAPGRGGRGGAVSVRGRGRGHGRRAPAASSRWTRSPTRTTWARSRAWPSAPGPTGCVIDAAAVGGGDGGRVPRLGGGRRAPADRARREPGSVPHRHPPARPLELRRGGRGRSRVPRRATTATGRCSSSERRGEACGRGCDRRATRRCRSPSAAGSSR